MAKRFDKDGIPTRQRAAGRSDRAPTMVDVARAAGVSLATVSATVNGSAPVSAERKTRVEAANLAVGYKANAVARSLKTGTTRTIGLMVADITNPFFTAVIHTIQDVAHGHGYGVMLCCSDESPDKERRHLRLLADRQVDGFIVATAGDNDELRALVAGGRAPVVLIDRVLPDLAADAVVIDNAGATAAAVRHLVALGHRRIGLITGISTLSTGRERHEGYCAALAEAGIGVAAELVGAARFGSDDGYSAAAKLLALADRPTAIFASNNLSGIGLMRAITDAGLDCPRDVSVACFDDFEWASVFHPRLTTVRQPTEAIGITAMALLIERLKDATLRGTPARLVRLEAELRIRDSTAAPPTGPVTRK